VQNWTPARFLCLLALLGGVLLFFELGRGDMRTADEGQRAAPPAEMLRSGDFLMPVLNGRPYLAKPPLLYWVVAGFYEVTGTINEWTARIPTALSGFLMSLALYLVFRGAAGEGPARWGALMLLASPYFLERSRWCNLEVPTWCCTFLAVAACWHAWQAEGTGARWGRTLLAGLALAAATLLKGPVPYLFLAASFLAFLVVEGNDPDRATRHGARWIAITVGSAFALWLVDAALGAAGVATGLSSVVFPASMAALLGGWIYLAARHGGPAWRRATPPLLLVLVMGMGFAAPWAWAIVDRLGWEQVQALLNLEVVERTHTATEINSGSPLFFFSQLPLILAPWGLLFPLHLSRQAWAAQGRLYRWAVLAGWLSVAIFSLIAGKEREYVMPAAPLLLLGVGFHVAAFSAARPGDWTRDYLAWWAPVARWVIVAVAVGVPIVAATQDYRGPLMLAEITLLCLVAAGLLAWPRHMEWSRLTLRLVAAVGLVAVAGLLMRAYYATGTGSFREPARLCRDLVAQGHRVEATKIYPPFFFYAEYAIPETVDEAAIRARLAGPDPYFYLTRKEFLPAFTGVEGTTLFASRAYGDKHLVLIGNRDGDSLLPPPTDHRAAMEPIGAGS
jgi:4-amino-4-deoxy-L-arabinose transferase-like glycosyltransferase